MDDPFAAYESPSTVPVAVQAAATMMLGPPTSGWLASIFGAGFVLSAFTTYLSARRYSVDGLRTKLLATSAALLVTAFAALSFAQLFYHANSQARSIHSLSLTWTGDVIPPALGGIIGVMAQVAQAWRAGQCFSSRTRLSLAVPFALIATFSLVASIGSSASLGMIYSSSRAPSRTSVRLSNIFTAGWLSSALVLNIAVSVLMHLAIRSKERSVDRPVQERTLWTRLRRVADVSVHTTVLSVLAAITWAIFPLPGTIATLNVWMAFAQPLPTCYALAILLPLASTDLLADPQSPAPTSPEGTASTGCGKSPPCSPGVDTRTFRVAFDEATMSRYSKEAKGFAFDSPRPPGSPLPPL